MGWCVFKNLQESDSNNRQDSSDVVYLLQNVAFRNSFHARVIFWEIRKGKAGEYESVPNPVEVNEGTNMVLPELGSYIVTHIVHLHVACVDRS